MWKKNIRNEIYTILFGSVMALIIIFWPKQVMAEEYYRPVEPKNPVLLAEEPLSEFSEIASGEFKNISWNIDSKGCLTISGTGDYYDTSSGRITIPWLDYVDKVKSAKVSVSGITSTTYMFSGCENLESISFDNFDTSAVTNMSYMFSICSSLKNLDLSSLNTGNVRTMEGMFYKCKALKNLDLHNF